jgi:hypothetical protein
MDNTEDKYINDLSVIKNNYNLVNKLKIIKLIHAKQISSILFGSILFGFIYQIVDNIYLYYPEIHYLYNGPDIYYRLKILSTNQTRFINLTKYLFKLRNVVIHNRHLDIGLIQKITFELIKIFESEYNMLIHIDDSIFNSINSMISVFKKFIKEWNKIYGFIITESQYKIVNFDAGLIGKIETPNNVNKEKIIGKIETPNNVNKEKIIEKIEIPINDNKKEFITDEKEGTFKFFRSNGWRELLKGRTILILEGKWIDNTAIFIGWNGTICNILLSDEKRISICIDKKIRII